jgi:predicted nuclease of predicted toxin-antitoxin system
LKFLVDRCAGRRLADWLREQGHDVFEVSELGEDPGDEAVLDRAVADARVLVTLDNDFGELIFRRDAPHAGLIRLPDVRVGPRIDLLDQVLARHAADLDRGAIVTVRGRRVRITLPD